MGVSAVGRAARWLVSVDPVPAHVYETWQCPVPSCGRDVEVETVPTYLRMHGGWLPPGSSELVALCARQHGAHRRDGSPPRELSVAADPLADWRLCVRWGADEVLVLDPVVPAVLLRLPSGDGWDAWALDGRDLAASDLVGPFSRLVRRGGRARSLGVVLAGDVRFSGDHVDCPTLRAWQSSPVSTSTSSRSGWTPGGSAAGPSSPPR